MNERSRRILITFAVLALVAGIAGVIIFGGRQKDAQLAAGDPAPIAGLPKEPGAGATSAPSAPPVAAPGAVATPPATPLKLTARAPGAPVPAGTKLGSLDPSKARFELQIAPEGAGVQRVVFSEYWHKAEQSRQAREHWSAVGSGAAVIPPLPPDADRYTLQSPGTLAGIDVSLIAARFLQVDDSPELVVLFGAVWTQTAPGEFTTSIVDAAGVEQLRVVRRYLLSAERFDVALEQRVMNTGTVARRVQWIQNGPPDLGREPGQLVETRRFQSGYLMSPERDAAQSTVIVHGALVDHAAVLKQLKADPPDQVIWPTAQQAAEKYGLSWIGSTNRYFALAIHAPYSPPTAPGKLIAPAVARVEAQPGNALWDGKPEDVVYTFTRSATLTVEPGATAAFDLGFFAGPLDRTLLSTVEPYSALNMQGLILYLMSGCCSWCTFSWLADLLIGFLTLLHNYVVFDWALSIIVLVIVVRLLLHPLTRRSQISMQKVTRQMQALKPELDALKKRYGDDPKKMQEEQVRIYRERGINPLGCAGGMLPTFFQMPIWIALYAMLYFAFELRQQPAFFGIFQKFGGWSFLGDLSAPDSFIPLGRTFNLYIVQVSSINLIPLLMGGIFFVQQKYMTPPPTTQMTPEQESQQKIMKWMMVLLFPLMLYSAPSGLTLYIATSTLVGVWEGMRVRKEVATMDFSKPQPKSNSWLAKAYEKAMDRASKAQKATQQAAPQRGPTKRFRDR